MATLLLLLPYQKVTSRNGKSLKTLKGQQGEIPIEVPRDRNGEFDPQFVKKRQTQFDGFDDKIISLYARGMTASEIQGHLEEIYGVEVSPELIVCSTSITVPSTTIRIPVPLNQIKRLSSCCFLEKPIILTVRNAPSVTKASDFS